LLLSKESGVKISSLLFECIPYIHEDNLDALYEEIKLFENYEKQLKEAVWQGMDLGNKPAALSNGRQKTALKNKVIADLKNYLTAKPVPDKRQVERVKNEILQILGQTPVQPAAPMQLEAAPEPLPPVSKDNQHNLVNIIQKSIPFGFLGGNNDKLKNKVTEIILNEYKSGNRSVENLIQKVKSGVGMTGFGSQNELLNTLRLNLNKALKTGRVQLTESV
jgi:hypothetical protein